MKKYTHYLIALFLLFTSTKLLAQNAKLKVAYTWLLVRTQHQGNIQVNPETGQQGSGVSYHATIVLKLKKGITPNFTNAVIDGKNYPIEIKAIGTSYSVGDQQKTAKPLQLKVDKGYQLWQVAITDALPTMPEQGSLNFGLQYPAKNMHHFSQTPIFISTIPAE